MRRNLVCSFLGSLSSIFYKDLRIEQENRGKIRLDYGHINRSADTGFLIRNVHIEDSVHGEMSW